MGLSHKRGGSFLKYPLPGRGKFLICLNCLKITDPPLGINNEQSLSTHGLDTTRLDAILERPGTFCLDLMFSVFLETIRSQMKRRRFSVYYRFVYSFSRSFLLIQSVFSYRKISILIGYTVFKQDQLRSTIILLQMTSFHPPKS